VWYDLIMKNIIHFFVTRDEDGFYTADAMNAPIVTQANTFEELQNNIREAVELFFENESPSSLGFASFPSVVTNFEVSLNNVAKA